MERGEETVLVAEGVQAANMRVHRLKDQQRHSSPPDLAKLFANRTSTKRADSLRFRAGMEKSERS